MRPIIFFGPKNLFCFKIFVTNFFFQMLILPKICLTQILLALCLSKICPKLITLDLVCINFVLRYYITMFTEETQTRLLDIDIFIAFNYENVQAFCTVNWVQYWKLFEKAMKEAINREVLQHVLTVQVCSYFHYKQIIREHFSMI